MDRALIERMVGAVVLVLLLVVVAPALLDGSRVSDSDSLSPESDGATRTEIIVLNGGSGSSAEAEFAPVEKTVEKQLARTERAVEQRPAPVVVQEPAKKTQPARRPEGFAVQIGSFGKKNNADQFAAGLAGEGYAVFVMAARTSAGTVYRVNAGPRATRAEAEKLAATISKSGRSVMVFELDADANGGSR